jgi:hypothetical protein
MLQAEQTSGLVRTSPTDNSGAENHPKDDTVHNGEQQQAESDLTEAELVAALLRKGVSSPRLGGPEHRQLAQIADALPKR